MKLIWSLLVFLAVMMSSLLPSVALAACPTGYHEDPPGSGTCVIDDEGGSGDDDDDDSTGAGLENPVSRYGTLDQLILGVVNGLMQVGFYLVVIFIIYSGFKFVKAQGDPKGLSEAKDTFLYTVIGAAILLGAVVLATVIEGTINELKKPPTQGAIIIEHNIV